MLPANSLQKLCDRTVLCAVAGLLTFPVLAGGGLSYWSRALIQLTSAAVLGLWSMRALLRRPQPIRPPITSGVMPYGLVVLALVTAPLVPLPPTLVGWLSPHAFDVYHTALPDWPGRPPFGDLFAALHATPPLLHLPAFLPLPASWRALSLVPYDSWATLWMGMSYAVLGAVVALYPWGHELRALRWLVIAVIVVAVFEAAYAFVQQSNGDSRILWFECPAHATCTGTYLNRNHFAGLLEMALPLLVARAVATWRKRHHTFGSDLVHGGWLTRGAHMLAQLSEPAAGRAASLWCLALLVVVALAASGSRSAFVATVVAIALTTAGRIRMVNGRSRAAIAVAVVIGAAVWLLFPQFTERVGSGDIARTSIAADTLDMTRAFPLFGVGIGNFGAGFQLYRRRTIQSWAYGVDVDHAHNDYLEWLSEVGLPAAAASLALLGILAAQVIRADHEHRATADEALLFWGFATGALALLVHAFTDFNLHIPANALVFTFLAGALVRLARRRTAATADHGQRRLRVVRARTPALVALAVSAAWTVFVWQRWDAEAMLHRVNPGSALRSLMTPAETPAGAPALALAQEAAARLPNAPDAQLELAHQLAGMSAAPSAAADAFVRSLWAAPVQPRALLGLARTTEAATTAPVVYDLLDRAAAMAPYDPRVRLDVADWYLQHWASLPADVRVHATTVVDAALALTAHLPGSGTPRQRTLDAYLRVAGAAAPLAPAAFSTE
jgi:O-antigen ligase